MRAEFTSRARRVAGWAVLACAPLLVTACSPGSATAAPASSQASAALAAKTGASTFLAPGQDINGTALYRPACNSGCPLSGDSTAILDKMSWRTWSATEAVGTGIYKLDACNPNCAAGPVYSVATVVTLSNPVKVCSSPEPAGSGPAPRSFPAGLPKALHGGSAPKNPWVFSAVASAAQQSCAG